MMHDALEIVRAFVGRINAHDVDGLTALMSEDHAFIDATGQLIVGKDIMHVGWQRYFASFPDYRIEVDDLFASDDTVAAYGHASGGASSWRIPAAWRGVIREALVAEWRVYCDVEPMLRSIGVHRWGEQG